MISIGNIAICMYKSIKRIQIKPYKPIPRHKQHVIQVNFLSVGFKIFFSVFFFLDQVAMPRL